MGRKKTRAADIRRRLKEDDEPVSPFASIKLVEKKEPEKKKAKPPVKPVPRKPSEIVQGYNPSSSFADILYAYEHTGNPYAMPSAARKSEIASSKTDFGAILDKWEGRGVAPKKKTAGKAEEKKSSYKPTKSFGDILASFEGGSPAAKENPAAKAEIVEDIPDGEPLFRKENEDEKRAPGAAWSIFGNNSSFVRKETEKTAESKAEEETGKATQRVSRPYSPTKSFAEILSSYEGKGRKEPAAKAVPAVPEKKAAAEEKPLSDNLFKAESEDEKRAPEAVWSVFGNNRVPERKEKMTETESRSSDDEKKSVYQPSADFSNILSAYEKKSEKTFDEIMKEKGERSSEKPQLTISKLRTMMPQATLDLHGYKISEAESRVRSFLDECSRSGLRKISIITGKGLHSEDGIGVLRDAAIRVLDESGMVSEKNSAPQSAGGSGALWIILKA